MPADYVSTARALSLPSPSEPDDLRPPWRHSTLPASDAVTLRDRVINGATRMSRNVEKTWQKMSIWQRVGVVFASIAVIVLGVAFMIFTKQVFAWLAPVAEKWEKSKVAFLVLWLCVFFVSFPPLVGWSTLGTVAGYIFGLWKGWLLYTTASVLGSTCSFVVSRTILSKFVHRLMERDKRFAALSLTLKYDGLKLLCMIRLCPLPYSICNGAVSTFPTVQPLMYGLATAIISPKMLVPAFVGSRIRLLSDENNHMSAGTKAVNIGSIIVTVGIGIFTGWYIYKRTMARAKELEAKEREDIRRNGADGANVASLDEEAQIGFDEDEDDLDLDMDSSDVEADRIKSGSERLYRDEFTDNESDVFRDGDGDWDGADSEAYGLHTHVVRSESQTK